MKKSLTSIAAEAFKNGEYKVALEHYNKLAKLLGERLFSANIRLCQLKLQKLSGREYKLLPLGEIKVACVMDDFTFHSFEPECDLLQLTPKNVLHELNRFKPDLMFIESAWRGKNELWNRKIGAVSQELKSAIDWCKTYNVPTVFWNKEDPVHFETFLTTAQQFDHVFTTDIDCIARYKAALGHDRVYFLPFASQPKIQNPTELYKRKDAFCFAGAYYVRYPDRIRDLKSYVDEFPKFKPVEIYDRNFGKDDINYQFPSEYQQYIVGTLPFTEINKAYKGYRYSINLNSIKQSQSMFARRVYELLASNTITVSNFSRGLRMMFGDLVFASDNGKEIIDRLKNLNDDFEDKLRLAGLRKVMHEHTYQHRLSYVCQKALAWAQVDQLPKILVVALISSKDQLNWVIENYRRQIYDRKKLLIGITRNLSLSEFEFKNDKSIVTIDVEELYRKRMGDLVVGVDWITLMDAEDYYGINYLLDLSLATRYTSQTAIGKKIYYGITNEEVLIEGDGAPYVEDSKLTINNTIVSVSELNSNEKFSTWADKISTNGINGYSIDRFNYCKNARCIKDFSIIRKKVDDLEINTGIPLREILLKTERIPPDRNFKTSINKFNAIELYKYLGKTNHKEVLFELQKDGLFINSELLEGNHVYFYSRNDFSLTVLPDRKLIESFLDVSPGLDLEYVFVYLNERKQKIAHSIHRGNKNNISNIPDSTVFIRLGWRVCGPGKATIRCMMLEHQNFVPSVILGSSDTLLLTNHYPSYRDLYRNGFVHSRVKAYNKRGVYVDVFRFQPNVQLNFHEFEGVDVVTGDQSVLRAALDSGRYRTVLVHFLTKEMWEVLVSYPRIHKIVWVHGSEIQPWYRREYNYQTEQELNSAKAESEMRIAFWREILNPFAEGLHLIFVSRYFAEEVMEDLGFRLSDESYRIIHNPIDTKLFNYIPKSLEQRKKVLSIRPYASRKYANDLSVQAILNLSKRPFFKELEFRMIGDGVLFDQTLEPLKSFSNVVIERRFLSQAEIGALHKEYGLFLVPTRMDAQGVSRDEAMSSGLVPLTNSVAAIPEFVDETCGFLAGAEDFDALANGIEALFNDPKWFSELSKAAAQRVREQCSADSVISQELALFSDANQRS